MRRIAILLALGLLAAPFRAETPAATDASGGTPRIEFLKNAHNFGTRDAGEDLTTTFAFRNVGDAVLHIVKVKGG